MNSPLCSVRPLISFFSALTLATATADLQVGAGAGVFTGSEYDETIGYGLEGEFGYLTQGQPINLFIGVRASYVDGLESAGSVLNSKDSSDLDLFEGTVVGRLLIPLGTDLIKIYGEGSLGSANLFPGMPKSKEVSGARNIPSIASLMRATGSLPGAWGPGSNLISPITSVCASATTSTASVTPRSSASSSIPAACTASLPH